MRITSLSSTVLGLVLMTGCASPGNPHPPSLHLPDKVTELAASRIGDRVKISWTPPTRTTDGVDITFPVTVEVCRDLMVPAQAVRPRRPVPTPCTPVVHLAGQAGPSTAEDILPPALTVGPRAALVYRLRLLNPAGRSAEPSVPVYVASGPAEPMVGSFRATQTRRGIVLEWDPVPAETAVEVTRTLILPAGQAVAKPAAKPGEKKLSVGKKKDPGAPVLLRPETPAAGMLDPIPAVAKTATQTYAYSAQRIVSVEVAGHALALRSEPTKGVTLALRDTFPPERPRGLVSVPGNLGGKTTLDLSWDPSPEPDLAGYRVYRVDLADASAAPRLLNPEALPGPSFRDATVLPNHRYRYSVTAVDLSGNESAASVTIEDAP